MSVYNPNVHIYRYIYKINIYIIKVGLYDLGDISKLNGPMIL